MPPDPYHTLAFVGALFLAGVVFTVVWSVLHWFGWLDREDSDK